MAKSSKWSLGVVLTQVALALYLTVTGLFTLGLGGNRSSSELTRAVHKLLNGDLANVVVILLGVVVLVCGIMLILRFFWNPGTLDGLFKLITLIAWIVVTVVIDICGFGSFHSIWEWILSVAGNLLIIGALLVVHD
ncbi:MAG: hypothetical protein K2K67_00140 [Treponemataceae bacterium]|nr:hypothetical protein [Treponemataceae bacterium]